MTTLTRERRAELLALAPEEELVELADRCIAARPDLRVVVAPETGMVMMQVREPVESIRFYVGEVLVTRAEVVLGGERGWGMRMGNSRVAALAAAICDAVAEAGASFGAEVAALCDRTVEQQAEIEAIEWAQLSATAVDFEEMD